MVRFWWNRFGPLFAAEIRRSRFRRMRAHSNWQWHLDEVFVKINGETHYLWRAVDHEGEVLESYVTKRRDRKSALKFLGKTMKRFGRPHVIVTDLLQSYGAAMKVIGNAGRQETGRWPNNMAENSQLPFRRRERAMLRFLGYWSPILRSDRDTKKLPSNRISLHMSGAGGRFSQFSILGCCSGSANVPVTFDSYLMTTGLQVCDCFVRKPCFHKK